jgi:hypothetical protein
MAPRAFGEKDRRNAGDVLVRHRRRFARLGQHRIDAEERGEVDDAQEVVREHARVQHRVRDAGDHAEQLVNQPGLSCHVRGMRAVRGPLAQLNDVFELGLPRRHGERRRALQRVRAKRREVKGALGPARG